MRLPFARRAGRRSSVAQLHPGRAMNYSEQTFQQLPLYFEKLVGVSNWGILKQGILVLEGFAGDLILLPGFTFLELKSVF